MGKPRAVEVCRLPIPLHLTSQLQTILERGALIRQATLQLAKGTGVATKHRTSGSSFDTDLLCDFGHRFLSVPHFPHL